MQYLNRHGEPTSLIQLIREEPEWAESRINALIDALSDLLDEQNGPPLLRRKTQWQAAVDKAIKTLGRSNM